MSHLLSTKNKFYISPCKHKWCMDCNLNPKFPRKCPYCRICVPLSQNQKRKWKKGTYKRNKKNFVFCYSQLIWIWCLTITNLHYKPFCYRDNNRSVCLYNHQLT